MNFRLKRTRAGTIRAASNLCGREIPVSEQDRQSNDETNDRTFNEEQKPLFGSDDTPDKTRQRTPGTQSIPPTEPDAEAGEAPTGI